MGFNQAHNSAIQTSSGTVGTSATTTVTIGLVSTDTIHVENKGTVSLYISFGGVSGIDQEYELEASDLMTIKIKASAVKLRNASGSFTCAYKLVALGD